VAAAAARAIQLLRARRAGARILDPFGTAVIAIVIALAVWAVALGLDATGFLFGATNQEARPFLLVAFGFVVGLGLPGEGRTTKITTICSGAALIVLAALSAIALVGGAASIALNAYYTPFYDSALPAAAGAVALALLFYRGHSAWWTRVIVFIAAVEIVVISLRRNVWLAAAAVLLLGLVAAHGRGQAARRIVGAVLILVPLLISLPAATAALASRLYDTLYALSDDTDVSTQGHIRDIEIGWQYATGSPISGLGSRHPQLPGVVDQNNGLIYLHNEWLLDWLRFGVPGLVLMVALMLLLVFGSVSVLRARSNLSLPHLTAAMFLLLLPISCVTAPFLSTTNRWPALIGIAAGVLTSARIAVQHTPPRASEPDQGADVRAEFPRVDAQRIPSS
jgi:O-antigen ligase